MQVLQRKQGDPAVALAMLEKAATLGSARGKYRLAQLKLTGSLGVPQDIANGLRLCEEAADAGHADSMYYLGIICYSGEFGMPPDKVAAAKYYKQAGETGHVKAIRALSGMLSNGDGIPQDTALATQWMIKLVQNEKNVGDLSADEQALKRKVAEMKSDVVDTELGGRMSSDLHPKGRTRGR